MEEPGITLDGIDDLLELLDQIVDEQGGAKSINAALRKATRKAVKEIVLPVVKSRIPKDTRFLEKSLKVRALTRKKGKVGATVGFPDPLFQGDTYYGGFQEFPHKRRDGILTEPDGYLRKSLYENERPVEELVKRELAQWVQDRNREA
jgi:hypothetical protein